MTQMLANTVQFNYPVYKRTKFYLNAVMQVKMSSQNVCWAQNIYVVPVAGGHFFKTL